MGFDAAVLETSVERQIVRRQTQRQVVSLVNRQGRDGSVPEVVGSPQAALIAAVNSDRDESDGGRGRRNKGIVFVLPAHRRGQGGRKGPGAGQIDRFGNGRRGFS